MKVFSLIPATSLITVAAILSGCGVFDDDNKGKTSEELAAESRAAAARSKQEAELAARLAKASRQEYEAELTLEMAKLQNKINELENQRYQSDDSEITAKIDERIRDAKEAAANADAKLDEIKKSAEAQFEAQKNNVTETFQSATRKIDSYVERQKAELEIDKKLNQIEDRINSLQNEIANASGEAKQKLQETHDSLQARYNDLKPKMKELRLSAEDKWEDLKKGFDNAFDEISDTFEDVF